MHIISFYIRNETNLININIDNKQVIGRVFKTEGSIKVFFNGCEEEFTISKKRTYDLKSILPKKKINNNEKKILSPMPGKITKIFVEEEKQVSVGDNLLVLDAMKMENIIKADFSGTVKKILVNENGSVAADEVLIVFD